MNKYLIIFRGSNTHSRIVEAPNASMACNLCIDKIETYEQISDQKLVLLSFQSPKKLL